MKMLTVGFFNISIFKRAGFFNVNLDFFHIPKLSLLAEKSLFKFTIKVKSWRMIQRRIFWTQNP